MILADHVRFPKAWCKRIPNQFITSADRLRTPLPDDVEMADVRPKRIKKRDQKCDKSGFREDDDPQARIRKSIADIASSAKSLPSGSFPQVLRDRP